MALIRAAGAKGLPRKTVLADLQKSMKINDQAVSVMFAAMVSTKQIAVIGQAIQGNYPGVALNVKIYAVYGTPKLPGEMTLAPKGRKPGFGKKPRSSGVITPPPYRTGLRWGLL